MRYLWLRIINVVLVLISLFDLSAMQLRNPILIYNQFPRVWSMDFKEMAAYLPKISSMGFNVVWVNPFFKTSNAVVVNRVDEGKGIPITASNSLYAMYDPSLIDSESPESSIGDPLGDPETVEVTNALIKQYTDEARKNNLVPIFDLVLNHVARDSPLVSGSFEHFCKLHVDTKRWFKENSERWDDVSVFNYDTEENRSEIFEHLWRPLIIRAITKFGFEGVRIDYGTDVNQFVLKRCIDLIRRLKADAPIITFGEALIPVEKPKDAVLEACRATGFTNLTNLAIFLTEPQISDGKEKYEWFLSDLGKKKLVSSGHPSKFWNGTIGFSGSHDHGTTLQAAVRSSVVQIEVERYDLNLEGIPREFSDNYKLSEKIIRGKITDEKLKAINSNERLRLAKERMAIAAFSSDAGWYFMVGDEILSTITKRPFVKAKSGEHFGGGTDDMSSFNLADPLPTFIKNINDTFKLLREAPDKFWVEMFYLDEKRNGICFVRHLSKHILSVDVVVVNLNGHYSIDNIKDIKSLLSSKKAEIDVEQLDVKYFYFVN